MEGARARGTPADAPPAARCCAPDPAAPATTRATTDQPAPWSRTAGEAQHGKRRRERFGRGAERSRGERGGGGGPGRWGRGGGNGGRGKVAGASVGMDVTDTVCPGRHSSASGPCGDTQYRASARSRGSGEGGARSLLHLMSLVFLGPPAVSSSTAVSVPWSVGRTIRAFGSVRIRPAKWVPTGRAELRMYRPGHVARSRSAARHTHSFDSITTPTA